MENVGRKGRSNRKKWYQGFRPPKVVLFFFPNLGFTIKKPVNLTLVLVNLILWSTGQTGLPGDIRMQRKCVSVWSLALLRADALGKKDPLLQLGIQASWLLCMFPSSMSLESALPLMLEIAFGT